MDKAILKKYWFGISMAWVIIAMLATAAWMMGAEQRRIGNTVVAILSDAANSRSVDEAADKLLDFVEMAGADGRRIVRSRDLVGIDLSGLVLPDSIMAELHRAAKTLGFQGSRELEPDLGYLDVWNGHDVVWIRPVPNNVVKMS